ncbi:hypothetical protein [Massilia sp. METH4]|uniref:hypothetical protein n=1 Tax=Massilia sp. METH4 TaxID=3123041 RepID=UPI0030D04917
MRRLFVIFLALLFPLNVYALSMSVSSMQGGVPAQAPEHLVALADAVVIDADFDLDPDEPPAGMDFHDTVSAPPRLLRAVPPDTSISSALPDWRGLDPLPPIKPPPAA